MLFRSGNDQGVHYNVYLKDPPESSFYSITPLVPVAGGFAPRGEFVTETVDFTAPEGYKQLCVKINDKEECGFKQVSTSFAIDYLRDQFVSDELKRKDITSQKECISGRSFSAGSLLNPNLEEAAQEAIDPSAYNRGVVRICASENPGSATDPDRFVGVGYCDDQNIGCWLDKKSVDNALSNNLNINEGLKAETLSELEQTQLDNLISGGEIIEPYQTQTIIEDLERQRATINKNNVEEFAELIDATIAKTLFNSQKAQLLFIKGQFYKVVALQLLKPIEVRAPQQEIKSDISESDEKETNLAEQTDEETKTSYQINSIDYIVNGEIIEQAQLEEELELKIKHDCDYIKLQINFNGAPYLQSQDIPEKEYITELGTSSPGRYLASIECWDSVNARRVGSKQIKGIDVIY